MSVRRIRASGVAVAALLLVVGLAGCTPVVIAQSEAISPPDPSAAGFGDAFSMDEGRVVVSATVGGTLSCTSSTGPRRGRPTRPRHPPRERPPAGRQRRRQRRHRW